MFTDIGIDLGTYKTAIMSGKRVIFEEPSAVAVDSNSGKALFFGRDAHELEGRTDKNITVFRPIQRGVVSDMELASAMIRYFFKKAFGNRIIKPHVVVTAPGCATAVEQRSAAQVVEEAGGRDVRVIETATAAAIGLGLNFTMPHGSMIVDIGAGVTDIAVVSMGGVAECVTIPVGSADYDEAIIKYIRHQMNIVIGPHTAEKIKMQIGSAFKRPIPMTMQAGGVDIRTGMPKSFSVTSDQIYEATGELSNSISSAVSQVLEKTLPDLAADIYSDGIILIGGGANMYGFPEHIAEVTGVSAALANESKTQVVRGAGIAVRNPNLLTASDYDHRTRENLFSDET